MSENFKIDLFLGAMFFFFMFLLVCWKYDQKAEELDNFKQQATENGAAHWVIMDNKGNVKFQWVNNSTNSIAK